MKLTSCAPACQPLGVCGPDVDPRVLLADLYQAWLDSCALLGVSIALRDQARVETLRSERGPHDVHAERVILAHSIYVNALPPGVRPEHFGEPMHAIIARAVILSRAERTGSPRSRRAARADIDSMIRGEVKGYLRGLADDVKTVRPEEVPLAVEIVLDLAARRRALALAMDAVALLQRPDNATSVEDAHIALQKALAATAPRRAVRRAA